MVMIDEKHCHEVVEFIKKERDLLYDKVDAATSEEDKELLKVELQTIDKLLKKIIPKCYSFHNGIFEVLYEFHAKYNSVLIDINGNEYPIDKNDWCSLDENMLRIHEKPVETGEIPPVKGAINLDYILTVHRRIDDGE